VVLRALADVSAARQVGVAWRRSAAAPDVHRLCESLRGRFGAVGAHRNTSRPVRASHARS
jgi:hypothetical protein